MVSYKWAAQTLRDRGIPHPPLESMQARMGAHSIAESKELEALLKKVLQGSESSAELERVQLLIAPLFSGGDDVDLEPSKVAQGPENLQRRKSHHIYGAKAALTVELDTLRPASPDDEHGGFTVSLDAARAVAPRQFAWTEKITFQFMRRELPLLACALLGKLDESLAFSNHGPNSNKKFEIKDQGGNLFVTLSEAGRMCAVPVGPSDVYAWLELVMIALNRNSPEVGDASILAMLDRVASIQGQIKQRVPT